MFGPAGQVVWRIRQSLAGSASSAVEFFVWSARARTIALRFCRFARSSASRRSCRWRWRSGFF